MNITVAENSGFCFGVKRAINILDELIEKKEKICVLGNIINNKYVVDKYEKKGVKIVKNIFELDINKILVIRSHGTTKEVFETINKNKFRCIDATCPFVKKIHNIVKNSNNKNFLLVAGNPNHPEVIGITSYFSGSCYVFSNLDELKNILNSDNKFKTQSGIILSQTTFSVEKFKNCVEYINNSFTNIKIYDTICNVTNLRQLESKKLSKISNLILIVGDYQSSNTSKLKEICSKYTDILHVNSEKQLSNYNLDFYENISIVGGASTPKEIIDNILNYIKGKELK